MKISKKYNGGKVSIGRKNRKNLHKPTTVNPKFEIFQKYLLYYSRNFHFKKFILFLSQYKKSSGYICDLKENYVNFFLKETFVSYSHQNVNMKASYLFKYSYMKGNIYNSQKIFFFFFFFLIDKYTPFFYINFRILFFFINKRKDILQKKKKLFGPHFIKLNHIRITIARKMNIKQFISRYLNNFIRKTLEKKKENLCTFSLFLRLGKIKNSINFTSFLVKFFLFMSFFLTENKNKCVNFLKTTKRIYFLQTIKNQSNIFFCKQFIPFLFSKIKNFNIHMIDRVFQNFLVETKNGNQKGKFFFRKYFKEKRIKTIENSLFRFFQIKYKNFFTKVRKNFSSSDFYFFSQKKFQKNKKALTKFLKFYISRISHKFKKDCFKKKITARKILFLCLEFHKKKEIQNLSSQNKKKNMIIMKKLFQQFHEYLNRKIKKNLKNSCSVEIISLFRFFGILQKCPLSMKIRKKFLDIFLRSWFLKFIINFLKDFFLKKIDWHNFFSYFQRHSDFRHSKKMSKQYQYYFYISSAFEGTLMYGLSLYLDVYTLFNGKPRFEFIHSLKIHKMLFEKRRINTLENLKKKLIGKKTKKKIFLFIFGHSPKTFFASRYHCFLKFSHLEKFFCFFCYIFIIKMKIDEKLFQNYRYKTRNDILTFGRYPTKNKETNFFMMYLHFRVNYCKKNFKLLSKVELDFIHFYLSQISKVSNEFQKTYYRKKLNIINCRISIFEKIKAEKFFSQAIFEYSQNNFNYTKDSICLKNIESEKFSINSIQLRKRKNFFTLEKKKKGNYNKIRKNLIRFGIQKCLSYNHILFSSFNLWLYFKNIVDITNKDTSGIFDTNISSKFTVLLSFFLCVDCDFFVSCAENDFGLKKINKNTKKKISMFLFQC